MVKVILELKTAKNDVQLFGCSVDHIKNHTLSGMCKCNCCPFALRPAFWDGCILLGGSKSNLDTVDDNSGAYSGS